MKYKAILLLFILVGMMLTVDLAWVMAQDGDLTAGYAKRTVSEREKLSVLIAPPTSGSRYLLYASAASPCVMSRCIPEPGNPNKCLGQPCMPGDEPPRPGLTCQVSGGSCQAPAGIVNAKKGDTILSSKCNMIGGLLSRLTPPQSYTHSGIMTRDHYEIRHSTSSADRVNDHRAGIGGMDGLDESVLRYGWPGVITQDINQAYNGQWFTDPGGRSYLITSFKADPGRCDGAAVLIWPRVVKPPPSASSPVRDKLREAADMAIASSGHYRFFAYSDGSIVGNSAYDAPPLLKSVLKVITLRSVVLLASTQVGVIRVA